MHLVRQDNVSKQIIYIYGTHVYIYIHFTHVFTYTAAHKILMLLLKRINSIYFKFILFSMSNYFAPEAFFCDTLADLLLRNEK
jgi:hypothetical protein